MDDLLGLTEVAHGLRERTLSPVEVVRQALDRAAIISPVLNAYITILGEQAMTEAQAAEQAIIDGEYRGPLHGVPVSVKDIYWTRRIRTTCGSRVLADFVPHDDAAVVSRLREAGAIIIAKANTYQFACSPPHPDFGATRNPWNLKRTTRGSSSGSAAAVASGIDYGSYGSDTGGSIRVPAAFCGITGLKPTLGRVSRYGMQPVSWTLDHAGPLARSATDLAVLFAAVSGPDGRDPGSIMRADTVTVGADGRLDGFVCGVIEDFMGDEVDAEILAAVEQAIDVLVDAGADIRRISIPDLRGAALAAHEQIMWPEAAHCHRDWYPRLAAEYTRHSQRHFAAAREVPAIAYLQGQEERRRIQARVAEMQREIDFLVLPTTPEVATPLERLDDDPDKLDADLVGVGAWNAPFDLTGQPAITLPCGFSGDGLPIGLQIVGRPFEDERVLHVGHVYQERTDWHSRHPHLQALLTESESEPDHKVGMG